VTDGATVPVRSVTVLPAVREDITLHTEDGLTLVGELASPVGPVTATLITLHPLSRGGGFMDSHLFRKAAWRLPYLADLSVLRFNTRGTHSPRGTSEGRFDGGLGEGADVRAAVDFAVLRGLPNRWLVGWSFGTDLVLVHGSDLDVEGAFLLSPPLSRAGLGHLEAWAETGKPVTILVPEHDEFLTPAEARAGFAPLTGAEVLVGEDASHLWVGERHVRWVFDRIVERVAPSRAPLPTEVPQEVVG
jgi:alpha/beta superfamily hydrolase